MAGIGDVRRLGRVGPRSFAYTFAISAISVVIGLGLANTIRPGDRVQPETVDQLLAVTGVTPAAPPQPVTATEFPNMLQLMFFAAARGG